MRIRIVVIATATIDKIDTTITTHIIIIILMMIIIIATHIIICIITIITCLVIIAITIIIISPWVCACSSPVCAGQPYTRGWLTMMEGGWMWPGWAEDNILSSRTGTGFSLLGRNHINVHFLGKCPHHCIFMHLRFSGKTGVQIPLKWLLFLVRRVHVLTEIHGVCAHTHFSLTVLSLPVKGISCDATVALFCPFRKPVRHCPRWGGPLVLLVSWCFHAQS